MKSFLIFPLLLEVNMQENTELTLSGKTSQAWEDVLFVCLISHIFAQGNYIFFIYMYFIFIEGTTGYLNIETWILTLYETFHSIIFTNLLKIIRYVSCKDSTFFFFTNGKTHIRSKALLKLLSFLFLPGSQVNRHEHTLPTVAAWTYFTLICSTCPQPPIF